LQLNGMRIKNIQELRNIKFMDQNK
jgi:hypothetical protein